MGPFKKATTLVTLGLNHATGLKIRHLVSATAVPLLAGVVRCVVSQLKVVKKKVFMSDVSYIFKAGQDFKKPHLCLQPLSISTLHLTAVQLEVLGFFLF